MTSFDYGLNAPSKPFDFTNKYLRITDIDEVTRTFSTADLVSPDSVLVNSDKYLAQEGDLFFARTGSVGRTYLYSKDDGRVLFAGYLIRAHINQALSDPNFVFYNTLTKAYQAFVKVASSRSVQPGINAKEYGSYQLAAPSLDEQGCIAALFQELDRNLSLNRAQLDKLEQLKQALLEQMFPRAGEDVPRLRIAGFTEPWSSKVAKELGSWKAGATPSRSNKRYWEDGTVNWLKTGELLDRTIDTVEERISQQALDSYGLRINPAGSVIIAMYCDTAGKLGLLSVPSATNQACCACIVEPQQADKWFVFASFLVDRAQLLKNLAGSAQPNLNKQKIEATKIPTTSLAEQERIGAFFEALDERLALKRAKVKKLEQLKRALLEQMFV